MTRTYLLRAALLAAAFAPPAAAGTFIPSGQTITPLAAPGAVFEDLNPGLADHPAYRAGQAIKTALSPDGRTLLVLTSGFNDLSARQGKLDGANSTEYVFVYDVSGANAVSPACKQVIKVADTFAGLAFAPGGNTFYVSGGVDDQIYGYTKASAGWALTAAIKLGHAPDKLASQKSNGFDSGGVGFKQLPSAAGIAVSADGKTLAVANIYNNSVSIIDTAAGRVAYEYNLQPFNTTPATGQGVAGGERPFAVQLVGKSRLYVSSLRDREIVVLDIGAASATTPPRLITRIKLPGNPNSMVLDSEASPTRLYVAQDNSDDIAVISLPDNRVIEQIDAIGPQGITRTAERYTGAAPNNLAIHGTTLYATNGGQNAVAVISLAGSAPHHTIGLIPTGWYPQAVSTSGDGKYLYIVNSKSPAGPNPDFASTATFRLKSTPYKSGNGVAQLAAYASNEYVLQIEKAGLLALKVPDAGELRVLTRQVAANNFYSVAEPKPAAETMAELHAKIKHIIYIVKENRTYDQVLGDLANGANGDPTLTVFGKTVTPNFHAIATEFVTLDNFYDSGEVSGNGWEWSTAARETDFNVKAIPLNYAMSPVATDADKKGHNRGGPYDAEGQNSDVNVGIAGLAEREVAEPLYGPISSVFPGGTANFFPGTNNDAAPDGPDGAAQTGYLWDSALRAGLTLRNYGFYVDLDPYDLPAGTPGALLPTDATPYAHHDVQAYASNPALIPYTDPYFRSFDNAYPDFWRFNEWNREFQQFIANKDLPNLTLLRFMHDHMGNFTSPNSVATGLNFPEAQQADDDYAVGLVAQAVANSPYKNNTLIFVVEDDAQDGPDHVDAHRSTAYVIGPYVKHKAVVNTRYTTVNMVRTIEDILGIDHLNLNDAYAEPMWTVFDPAQKDWSFTAAASPYLRGTADAAPGTKFSSDERLRPVKPAAWWGEQTKGFDWSKEDRVPAGLFNRIIWKGFKGDTPYPQSKNTTPDQD
jgi:DNA-binding beta-propeller fold protein YncE